jgi:ribosomal protein S18 acetylase RimI-like enzyme
MRTVRVRLAMHADLPWCRRVDPRTPVCVLRRSVREDEVLVAEVRGLRVGYLRLEWLWARKPFLAWIYVTSGYRRRGVGEALLTALEEQLIARGFTLLVSSAQDDAPGAIAWHRSVGFRRCGTLRGINRDGSDEVFFRKPIGALR